MSKDKSKPTSIRLDKELSECFEQRRSKLGLSQNDAMKAAIRLWLDKTTDLDGVVLVKLIEATHVEIERLADLSKLYFLYGRFNKEQYSDNYNLFISKHKIAKEKVPIDLKRLKIDMIELAIDKDDKLHALACNHIVGWFDEQALLCHNIENVKALRKCILNTSWLTLLTKYEPFSLEVDKWGKQEFEAGMDILARRRFENKFWGYYSV